MVADNAQILGVIHLKDIIKEGIRERFARLRAMGLRTVMITGDNPLTAAAIAHEAGVDDFRAEATPETKLALIREEQAQGKLVAMIGDGTNDAPALAQADVGIAMNAGTQAAREAGNMVDLDSNPTKIMEVVEIGKQLLITRGALTTFSIANDVAKYFAIIPAMFVLGYPELQTLNIMHLATPQSAILSAVIFNALIIIALIPLALRGVAYRPLGAAAILTPQPADLRPRRRDRAVHRHQAHRSLRNRVPSRVRRRKSHAHANNCNRDDHRADAGDRNRLSDSGMGNRAGAFPLAGERKPAHARRTRWWAPHLSDRISPPRNISIRRPSAAGDKGYDASNSGGVQPGADQSQTD